MVQVLLLKLIYFELGLIMNGIILTLFHLNLISISYTLVNESIFRYGVLGLIIVGIFFTDLVRHMKISYHKLNINFVILISLISLSLRFVIQPIFNDLLMSILIIAFYNLRDRKKLT